MLGLPVSIHAPSSLGLSNGMQRMVALVISLILSSVSAVPSQWADINPDLFSRTSSHYYIHWHVMILNRKWLLNFHECYKIFQWLFAEGITNRRGIIN